MVRSWKFWINGWFNTCSFRRNKEGRRYMHHRNSMKWTGCLWWGAMVLLRAELASYVQCYKKVAHTVHLPTKTLHWMGRWLHGANIANRSIPLRNKSPNNSTSAKCPAFFRPEQTALCGAFLWLKNCPSLLSHPQKCSADTCMSSIKGCPPLPFKTLTS